jgi:hypothetical protein
MNIYINELENNITDDQRKYLNDCIGKYVLVSDYIVRLCSLNGEFDYDEEGCEHTHVQNPTSKKFRFLMENQLQKLLS